MIVIHFHGNDRNKYADGEKLRVTKKKAGACDELCILLVKCQPPWNSKVGRKNMWFR